VRDVQWWRARIREARQTAGTAYGNQTFAFAEERARNH